MGKRGQYAGSSAGSSAQGLSGEAFGPIIKLFGKLLRFLGIILIIVIVFLVFFVGTRYFLFKQQTGELASTVTHATVAGEQALNPAQRFLRANAPSLYYVFYPEDYNPYAIDSTVEITEATRDLGVKILKFEPIKKFFMPSDDINLRGTIKAAGFQDSSYEIEVYCDLEGYKNSPIPGKLLGPNANGNKGIIDKGISTQFVVNCDFPGEVSVTKQETAKEAKLIVTYNFKTKTYARIWFLNKNTLLNLVSKTVDPFTLYNINDPLLDSEKNALSKQTPGPINLGMSIPFPQPLTTAEYQLLVKISRNIDEGNLQTLEGLSIQLPSVSDLNIVIKGEQGYTSASGACDFDYIGETEQGYKEYRLMPQRLAETNQDCGKQTLRDLALTELDCISIFKEPLFTCNFVVTRAPQTGLQSDVFTALADYTIKVDRKTVVTIRALPTQLVS